MSKPLDAKIDKIKTKSKDTVTTPDGSCCTAPPDGDPGPIKP